MKKILAILLLVFFVITCTSKHEKLVESIEENTFKRFEGAYNQMGHNLTRIEVYELDTITPKSLIIEKQKFVQGRILFLDQRLEQLKDLMESTTEFIYIARMCGRNANFEKKQLEVQMQDFEALYNEFVAFIKQDSIYDEEIKLCQDSTTILYYKAYLNAYSKKKGSQEEEEKEQGVVYATPEIKILIEDEVVIEKPSN